MSLPDPAELIRQMATDLNAHLSKRGISDPRFIGIRTGGVWVAQALLKALNNPLRWAHWTFRSIAMISARTACTLKCALLNCRSRSKASIWC